MIFGVVLVGTYTSVFIAAYTVVDGLGGRVSGSPSSYAGMVFAFDALFLLAYGLIARGPGIIAAVLPFWRSGCAGAGGFRQAQAHRGLAALGAQLGGQKKALQIAELICKNGPLAVQAILRSIHETEGMHENDAFKIDTQIGIINAIKFGVRTSKHERSSANVIAQGPRWSADQVAGSCGRMPGMPLGSLGTNVMTTPPSSFLSIAVWSRVALMASPPS